MGKKNGKNTYVTKTAKKWADINALYHSIKQVPC